MTIPSEPLYVLVDFDNLTPETKRKDIKSIASGIFEKNRLFNSSWKEPGIL